MGSSRPKGASKPLRVRNAKLCAVITKAASLGFRVDFVRKVFGPRHPQNRLYINGRRCQLVSAPAANAGNGWVQPLSGFRVPTNDWAEFLIYAPGSTPHDPDSFFIIPRHAALLNIAPYQDRWDLLKNRVASYTRHTTDKVGAPLHSHPVATRRDGQPEAQNSASG